MPQIGRKVYDQNAPKNFWVLRWADGPDHIEGENGNGESGSFLVMPYYQEFKTEAGAQRAARKLKERGARNIRVNSVDVAQSGRESNVGFESGPKPIRPAPKFAGDPTGGQDGGAVKCPWCGTPNYPNRQTGVSPWWCSKCEHDLSQARGVGNQRPFGDSNRPDR